MPNSKIFNAVIENNSYHPQRRLDVSVRVTYAVDLDHTREVLEKVADSIEQTVQGESRGTQVVLSDLGESSVKWTVRVWLKSDDYWSVKEILSRAIKMGLEKADIAIAMPRMTVDMTESQRQPV